MDIRVKYRPNNPTIIEAGVNEVYGPNQANSADTLSKRIHAIELSLMLHGGFNSFVVLLPIAKKSIRH